MPKARRPAALRRLLPRLLLGLLLALVALPAPLPAAKRKAKEIEAQIATLPAKYQQWLADVAVLISAEERDAFLELKEDYHRDAFIEQFWKARDPYPDTARNELRDRWQSRLEEARQRFSDLHDEMAQVFLLNGAPADERKVECSQLLWPTQIWFYPGSDRARFDFFLVFYKRGGGGPFRIWHPAEGLTELFQQAAGIFNVPPQQLVRQIANTCFRGDEVAAVFAHLLNQGPFEFEEVLGQVQSRPEPPKGEWVATFNAYSTQLDPGAATFPAELGVSFPGRRQNRTVLQGVVSVPLAELGRAELADFRAYNVVLTGEVLADDTLFDSFRYKFDQPASEVAGDALPLVFQRYLRPGAYRLVLKLEDLNNGRLCRLEQDLRVPELTEAPPPPPNPETAKLLAEANAFLATSEVSLKLIPPGGELLAGMRRIDTLVGGSGIDRVTFSLDGRDILTKKQPPYSVELDLGSLPRTRTLEAVAYDRTGRALASDQLLLNASSHRFSVRLVEPRRGAHYDGSLLARVEATPPDGQVIERVELFLNETRVATLFQEPYEQPIVLPKDEPLAYVQAVAYLPDGSSTQDLVFVNLPDAPDEIKVQYVELFTTVVDRQGKPVLGLAEPSFRVLEDGVAQEIRRFEQVRDLPLHLAVLLDVSASMEGRLPAARDAAMAFLQQVLTPKDRAAVITFNDRPNLVAKMTNDLHVLAGGLAGLKAERGTALYDSLIYGLYYFNGIKGQRAMLVLSDGKDESSKFRYEDALEYARRAGVTVYAVGLDLPKGEARRKLSQLADETGGRSIFVDSVGELPAIYRTIEEELRAQYLIAYQSTNTAVTGAFRTIEVKLDRGELEAKTLRGYYP